MLLDCLQFSGAAKVLGVWSASEEIFRSMADAETAAATADVRVAGDDQPPTTDAVASDPVDGPPPTVNGVAEAPGPAAPAVDAAAAVADNGAQSKSEGGTGHVDASDAAKYELHDKDAEAADRVVAALKSARLHVSRLYRVQAYFHWMKMTLRFSSKSVKTAKYLQC